MLSARSRWSTRLIVRTMTLWTDPGDDESFVLRDLGLVADDDWPGMPAQRSFDLITDEWPIGEQVDTMLNGPYLLIRPDEEDELLRLIQNPGHPVRRADAVINRLGE